MTIPTVSVVMSVFNGERFLAEAVGSILIQTFNNFEFIIINDGSTDGTAEILDSYHALDQRVRVYRHDNKGLVESLNRGCRLAHGKYIARMDADDIAVPERLASQVGFLEEHPEVGVLGGAAEVIDVAGRSLSINSTPIGDADIKSALLRDCAFIHPTVVMRRDVFLSVGGYRKIAVDAEDYDLWLRIADRWQLANLDTVVLKYRRHPCQVTIRRLRQMALSTIAVQVAAASRRSGKGDPLDTLSELTPAALASLGVSEALQQRGLARMYCGRIRAMLSAGEYGIAHTMLDEVFQSCDRNNIENWVLGDLQLSTGWCYWHQRRLGRSILALGHSLTTRPKLMGRPLKLLLRWIRNRPPQYCTSRALPES